MQLVPPGDAVYSPYLLLSTHQNVEAFFELPINVISAS